MTGVREVQSFALSMSHVILQTPLNNNIRELFNLMNFLDPDGWADLEALEKEFEELDEDRIKDMHERLRPYFLRRVKADVLDLPPKVSYSVIGRKFR